MVGVGRCLTLVKPGGIVMILQIRLKSRDTVYAAVISQRVEIGALYILNRLRLAVVLAGSANAVMEDLFVEVKASGSSNLLPGIV